MYYNNISKDIIIKIILSRKKIKNYKFIIIFFLGLSFRRINKNYMYIKKRSFSQLLIIIFVAITVTYYLYVEIQQTLSND